MSALLASVLLSVVSAVAYAAAAILQERIAATTAPSRYALLKRGRWWATVILNGAGALLHVVALGLGPLTVVQPLGVLTIVIAAPMAALVVKRPVTAEGWRGIVLVSVGLAAILLFTGAHQSRQLSGLEQYAVAAAAIAVIALLVGLAVLARGVHRAGARSVALAMAAGVAFGTASVCVKAVAEGWALTSVTATLPVLALIGLFAVTGLATSQASYRGGGLAAPLATSTVVNPVVAAAVGILLLEEGFRYGATGALTALAGALLAGRGLVILTGRSTSPTPSGDTGAATGTSTDTVVIPAPAPAPHTPRTTRRKRPAFADRGPRAAPGPRVPVPDTAPEGIPARVPDTVPEELALPTPH